VQGGEEDKQRKVAITSDLNGTMNRHRAAALLALVIGLLTIVEGSIVLLGLETNPYPVLPWLLRYNVAMGVVSLAASHGLWRERKWAETLSAIVLVCHGAVFLTLAGMSARKDRGDEQHRSDAVQDRDMGRVQLMIRRKAA